MRKLKEIKNIEDIKEETVKIEEAQSYSQLKDLQIGECYYKIHTEPNIGGSDLSMETALIIITGKGEEYPINYSGHIIEPIRHTIIKYAKIDANNLHKPIEYYLQKNVTKDTEKSRYLSTINSPLSQYSLQYETKYDDCTNTFFVSVNDHNAKVIIAELLKGVVDKFMLRQKAKQEDEYNKKQKYITEEAEDVLKRLFNK